MPVIAVLPGSRASQQHLRRSFGRSPVRVIVCRSERSLLRAYRGTMLDAVVLGPTALRDMDLVSLARSWPGVPRVAYGPFRPDDGVTLNAMVSTGVISALLIEGVDDAVAGPLAVRLGPSRRRADLLAGTPRVFRLTDPLQLQVWQFVVREAGRPLTVGQVAVEFRMSREHLSRQFAAGGAPNLKRAIDLLRVICATQLLANPGCDVARVVRLLQCSSPSHLSAMSRRIAGVSSTQLADLGPQGVLRAFTRNATRSRV